jgi:hypothetical protein
MKNKFKLKKYLVIKKVISKKLADFIFEYFSLKKTAVKYMYDNKIILEDENTHSLLGRFGDSQILNSYASYSDFVMETLLIKLLPIMKKHTKLDLIPTYSYARIYENGSILHRHRDRPSCEISTTLNIGGDPWPIYVDPTGSDNIIIDEYKNIIVKPNAPKGVKINLNPGDMLIYRGCDLEHWRERFTKKICTQVFLHYNEKNGNFKQDNLFDGRPVVGFPFKK